MAFVHQISVSNGGVPKTPVEEAEIGRTGVAGDRQADLVHHGGEDKALCLYSLEVIEGLRAEGHPIAPGLAGENLTISGLDWAEVLPGRRLRIGHEVTIEITDFTSPCAKNASWFTDGEFSRMLQSKYPGESRIYARVLSEGTIRHGDGVELVD